MISKYSQDAVAAIGNAILINGLFGAPRLGIIGAAISTNFSKCVGLIIVTYILIKKLMKECL